LSDTLPKWLSGVTGYPHSIWRQQSGEKPSRKRGFPSWPKPFNAIERITVYNCNEILMMRVTFLAEIAAEFWFDSKVPSPMELFRNWVFGQLRCGSKMGVKPHLPGPSDLFLRKSGRDVMIFSGAFLGSGLFVWAMTQSIFSALNTYSSLMNVQAFCEEPEARAILSAGDVLARHEGDQGVFTTYTTVYDPFGVTNQTTGFINVPNTASGRTAWGNGHFANLSGVTLTVDVYISFGSDPDGPKQRLVIGPGGDAGFNVAGAAPGGGVMALEFKIISGDPFPSALISADGLLAGDWGQTDNQFGGLGDFGDPQPRFQNCFARFPDGTPL